MGLEDLFSDSATSSSSAPSALQPDDDTHGLNAHPPSGAINFNASGQPPAYVDLVAIRKPWHRQFGAFSHQNVPHLGAIFFRHIGRPARQDEAEAIVEEIAQIASIKSLSQKIGFSGGVLVAMLRGPRSFPIPLPGVKTMKFTQLGPFRDSRAMVAWRIIQMGSWAIAGSIVSFTLTLTVAAPMIAWKYAQDPRLKDYYAVLRQNAIAKLERRRAMEPDAPERPGGQFTREADAATGHPTGETFEMARQKNMVQQRAHRRQQYEQQQDSRESYNHLKQISQVPRSDVSPTNEPSVEEHINFSDPTTLVVEKEDRYTQQRQPPNSKEDSLWGFVEHNTAFQHPDARHASIESPRKTNLSQGNAWERLRQKALNNESFSTSKDQWSEQAKPPRIG